MFAIWSIVAAFAAVPTASQVVALDRASERGQLLYDYDQAAWHSTDTLVAALGDPGRAGIRGYIVEPQAGGLRVTYYGLTLAGAVPVYVADFADGKVAGGRVIPTDERKPLTVAQMRLIKAREVAAKADVKRCSSKPFNTVVLPAANAGGPVDVYLLTPQAAAGSYPIGGHHRLIVSAEGKLLKSRTFANTCIALEASPTAKEQTVALVVTHLLDPIPTEIHVFTSLASRLPLGVSTKDGKMWWVAGSSICYDARKRKVRLAKGRATAVSARLCPAD